MEILIADLVGFTAFRYSYCVSYIILKYFFPIKSKYDISFFEKSIMKKWFNFKVE